MISTVHPLILWKSKRERGRGGVRVREREKKIIIWNKINIILFSKWVFCSKNWVNLRMSKKTYKFKIDLGEVGKVFNSLN